MGLLHFFYLLGYNDVRLLRFLHGDYDFIVRRRLTVGRTLLGRSSRFRAPYLRMRFNMLGQMIRSHELLGALRALEPLLAGVGPPMPLELVGPSEFLTAKYPTTDKRPFPGVPSQVSAQMAGFTVDLVAARYMAYVLPFSRHVPIPVGVTAVGTRAGDSPAMLLGGLALVVTGRRGGHLLMLLMRHRGRRRERVVRLKRLEDLPFGRVAGLQLNGGSGDDGRRCSGWQRLNGGRLKRAGRYNLNVAQAGDVLHGYRLEEAVGRVHPGLDLHYTAAADAPHHAALLRGKVGQSRRGNQRQLLALRARDCYRLDVSRLRGLSSGYVYHLAAG